MHIILQLREICTGFGWFKGEGNQLKSLTFVSGDSEWLCSITMLAPGLVKAKNRWMQEDIRSSYYSTVGKSSLPKSPFQQLFYGKI